MPTVHSFRAWDHAAGEFKTLPHKSTEERIAGIKGAEIVAGTAEEVDPIELDDNGRMLRPTSLDDLPFKAAAVLLWLPDGETPIAGDFQITEDETSKAPPHPNPEAWHELGDALGSALHTIRDAHQKLPWIKVGDIILSPKDIARAYEHFKAKVG